MTKNEYMKMLEIQLGKFSESVRQEIMEDYENHFAEALAQGKTEEEIIKELGDIQDMIDEIPEEDEKEEWMEAKGQGDIQNKVYPGEYRKMVVNGKALDVAVIASADNNIHVRYEGRKNQQVSCEEPLFYQYEKDGVFYVGVRESEAAMRNVTIGFLEHKVEIPFFKVYETGKLILEIPEGVRELEVMTGSGDIEAAQICGEELHVKTASGDVQVQKVNYKKTTVVSASGDIELQDINAEVLTVSATSGDVSTEGLTVQKLEIATSSGDIEVTRADAKETTIRTSSGDTSYSGKAAIFHGKSGSGDQEIGITNVLNQADIVSGSGDVELKLGSNTGATITAITGSGDVDVRTNYSYTQENNRFVVGDGTADINMKSGSGDIEVIL